MKPVSRRKFTRDYYSSIGRMAWRSRVTLCAQDASRTKRRVHAANAQHDFGHLQVFKFGMCAMPVPVKRVTVCYWRIRDPGSEPQNGDRVP